MSVVKKPGRENQAIPFDYVFDQTKLPVEKSEFVSGFNMKNYVKTQTEIPEIKDSYYEVSHIHAIDFEIDSPEILVLARAYKQVSSGCYGLSLEEETNQANDNVGYNFLLMKEYVANNLVLKYKVLIGDNLGWEYEFPVVTPSVVPGQKYRIKSGGSGKYIHIADDNINLISADYQPSNGRQLWNFIPNADGSYTISSAPSGGSVLDIFGAGTMSGTRIALYQPIANALNQKWKITPSTKPGYFVLNSLLNQNPILCLSSSPTDAGLWSINKNENDVNQDWSFEPVSDAARRPAPSMSAEENSVPSLHPNPVSDHLQVNLPAGYEQSTITILTVSGASLNLAVESQGSQRRIDVRQLQPGMYFIQVQAEGKFRQVLKFLKQ